MTNSAYHDFVENVKLDRLQIFRAALCFCVFLFHVGLPSEPLFWLGLDWRFLLYPDGPSAVRLFFLLSGFLIGKGFLSGKYTIDFLGIKKFYLSRIRRIVPLYYFIGAVFLVVIYRDLINMGGLNKILSVFTFTFDLDQKPSFTGIFWSLSVEMQFYLLTPVLVWIVSKMKKSQLRLMFGLLSMFIFIMCLRFASGFKLEFVSNQVNTFLANLTYFWSGLLLSSLKSRFLKPIFTRFWNSVLLTGVSVFSLILIGHNWIQIHAYDKVFLSYKFIFPVVLILLGSAIIWLTDEYSGQAKQIEWKKLKNSPLYLAEIFGLISYGFYLWHSEVIWVFDQYFGHEKYAQYGVTALLSFGVTLGLSIGTYYLIERGKLLNFVEYSWRKLVQ